MGAFRISILFSIAIFYCGNLFAALDETQIQSSLSQLENVVHVEAKGAVEENPGYYGFVLKYEQLLDHGNPGKGTFLQTVALSLKDLAMPVLFYHSGYALKERDLVGKLMPGVQHLRVNQVQVEHRYTGTSVPMENDYQHLDVEQASHDFHRVAESLKPLLSANWINAGHSKGGQVALAYRSFYPNDVKGTIVHGSHRAGKRNDPAFLNFFENVGTAECRQRIKDIQTAMLATEQRYEMVEAFRQKNEELGRTFNYIDDNYNLALEMTVLLIPQFFWKSYHQAGGCDSFPTQPQTLDQLASFLVENYHARDDATIEAMVPFYLENYLFRGYPALHTNHVEHLLQEDQEDFWLGALGEHANRPFNPSTVNSVADWVASEEASNIVIVYGELDTFSANPFQIHATAESRNVLKFTIPDKDHRATIFDLPGADRARVFGLMNGWLGH